MAKTPNTTTAPTGSIAPFGLRMLPELREQIETAARESGRSMNAEIVARLQQSFEPRNDADWELRVARHINEARLELLGDHQALLVGHVARLQEAMANASASDWDTTKILGIQRELAISRQELMALQDRRSTLVNEEFDLNKAYRQSTREELETLDKLADAAMQSDLMDIHQLEERMGVPAESRVSVKLAGEDRRASKPSDAHHTSKKEDAASSGAKAKLVIDKEANIVTHGTESMGLNEMIDFLAERIVQRSDKVILHTAGSGKTLSSMKAVLAQAESKKKPGKISKN